MLCVVGFIHTLVFLAQLRLQIFDFSVHNCKCTFHIGPSSSEYYMQCFLPVLFPVVDKIVLCSFYIFDLLRAI